MDMLSFTIVEDSEDQKKSLSPVYIHLLPGEILEYFNTLNYGCRLGLTNYRMIIVLDNCKNNLSDDEKVLFNKDSKIISIPFGLIYHIEYFGLVCVTIITKIARRFTLTFPDVELCEQTIVKLRELRKQSVYSMTFYQKLKKMNSVHFLMGPGYINDDFNEEKSVIEAEFKRLKYPSNKWRITNINKDYKVCATYPRYQTVLSNTSDDQIIKMSKFRSKNRFISVAYRFDPTGCYILRSGQPMTGVSSTRNSQDELYIKHVIESMKPDSETTEEINAGDQDPSEGDCISQSHPYKPKQEKQYKFKIFDARTYASAQLNKVHGGGMECDAYYDNCHVEFLNIPNMHAVRTSFEALSICLSKNSDTFLDELYRSNWLNLIRQLLECTVKVVSTIANERMSCLIHCTDGWDRTPQLVSLTQILVDPYYRTIQGFKVLVQKEWIYFGHKFNERLALFPNEVTREFSPIFVQWLDCIFQLYHQNPDAFEFNELFLIKMALHASSGLFGTFNTQLSRDSSDACSLWRFLLHKNQRCFLNPLYNPPSVEYHQICPRLNPVNIKLWSALYQDSLGVYDISDSVSSSSCNHSISHASVKPNGVTHQPQMAHSLMIRREPEFDEKQALKDFGEGEEDEEDDYEDEEDEQHARDRQHKIHQARQNSISMCYSDQCLLNGQISKLSASDNTSHNTPAKSSSSSTSNYYKIVELIDSLHSVETNNKHVRSANIANFQLLDLDGIYHQQDLINIYSNIYRHNRVVLGDQINFFRNKCQRLFKQVKSLKHRIHDLSHDDSHSSTNGQDSESEDTVTDQSRLSGDEDNMENDLDDVEIIPSMIYWLPDHSARSCGICDSSFGYITRRHHCRSCGKIFCNKCSSNKIPIPKENIIWPERVCDKCYEDIMSTASLQSPSAPQSRSSNNMFRYLPKFSIFQ